MTSEASSAFVATSNDRVRLPSEAALVELSGYVSARAVEEQVAIHRNEIAGAATLYFDLSRALYFETSGLLRILAMVAGRQSAQKFTRFRLPNDPPARHILRLWQFPGAVGAVTQTPFRLLVSREDWIYFGEEWPEVRLSTHAVSARASVLAYLAQRRSFGLVAYQLGGSSGLERMFQEQMAHWSGYALSSLLATVLAVPATDFARVVVQELLTNVLSLAAPTTMIIGSQLDLVAHSEIGAVAGLTIAVWHDGESVIDHFAAHGSSLGERRHAVDEEPAIDSAVSAGFTALCRTAIETFGGSVDVRGERRELSISLLDGRAATASFAEDLTPMIGDIVTVRLPIHDD